MIIMKKMSVTDIASAVGGKAVADGFVTSVFTDSRKSRKGGLFIALEGDKFDGHEFIKSAVDSGAAAVMCRKKTDVNVPVIYVENTKDALLKLSAFYRASFDIPVIGLTGSVGKTTTKDMIALVASAKYNTLKTQGNLNNDIGMPMTLLSMEENTECAVIEMGMNHFGEISRLTSASRPTIGVITNIGVSHIENLGSRENILKAKLEIIEGMTKGSPLILNGDNDMLKAVMSERFRIVFFGIDNPVCKVRADDITESGGCTQFTVISYGERARAELPAIGRHNVYNALAAIAVGHELGIELKDCAEALKNYVPSGMRQNIVRKNGVTFIEDCYNASPDSVKASLNALAGINAKRRIAVLGDMLELGGYSQTAHELCGEYCAQSGVDILLAYGEMSAATAQSAEKNGVRYTERFTDPDKLAVYLAGLLREGDAVVFKASHGMHLENVIKNVYEMIGR